MTGEFAGLIWLIIYLLLGGLVVYAAQWFIGQLALPQPVRTVLLVIVALVALVWLLGRFGVL